MLLVSGRAQPSGHYVDVHNNMVTTLDSARPRACSLRPSTTRSASLVAFPPVLRWSSRMTTKKTATAVFLAAAGMLSLAACGSDDSGSGSSASGSSAAAAKRACIMLPDADSSSRWENGDRPALEAGFKKIGFETDIQNALNDTGKYATLADQQLTKGCKVMLLVDLKGADYYVSFDNFHVGELEGQMIVDGLKAENKDPKTAKVIYMGGDPTDGNAKQFHDGADSIMSAAGIKPAAEPPGVWDGPKTAVNFEQALTSTGGKVDAVWVANDINAGAVIQVLDKNGLKVPVSGQDASPVGLQNVLLGKQFATVYKPFQLEAAASVDLAQKLANGEKPTADKKTDDGVPFLAMTPVVVTKENMQTVFDDGNAKVAEVCTGEVAAACTAAGIK